MRLFLDSSVLLAVIVVRSGILNAEPVNGFVAESDGASLRVFQADTAMAEVARVLGEELFLGRIVKIDSVAVGKVELEVAQGIGGSGPLADGAIPGYELLRELHRGGQGVVYLATQKATKRHVAISGTPMQQ